MGNKPGGTEQNERDQVWAGSCSGPRRDQVLQVQRAASLYPSVSLAELGAQRAWILRQVLIHLSLNIKNTEVCVSVGFSVGVLVCFVFGLFCFVGVFFPLIISIWSGWFRHNHTTKCRYTNRRRDKKQLKVKGFEINLTLMIFFANFSTEPTQGQTSLKSWPFSGSPASCLFTVLCAVGLSTTFCSLTNALWGFQGLSLPPPHGSKGNGGTGVSPQLLSYYLIDSHTVTSWSVLPSSKQKRVPKTKSVVKTVSPLK